MPRISSSKAWEAVRSSDAKRRGEIETAMREGNGSKYWADASMQREYGEILNRQAGPGPTAPAPDSASPLGPAAEPAGV